MSKITQIIEITQGDNINAGKFLVLHEDGALSLLDVGLDSGSPAYVLVPVKEST